uniref:Uncharacterized protein n=1 Tax=Opuntia streptacantha TaxID=393608 RepID=A0A7C9D9T4_OPUST
MISAGDKQVREETIAKYVNLNFHYYTRLVSFPLSVLPTMNHDQLLTMTLANWEVLALRYLSWRLPVSDHNDCIDGIDDPRNVSQQCQHQAYQELTAAAAESEADAERRKDDGEQNFAEAVSSLSCHFLLR